ncbi:MAG: hypothetical protein BGP25_05615 [Lysobacterales bacterium 63-13]|nr:MAG: hypothetical protein BGP25_05615 [Xanthomonadales bacterium 63-13]
MLKFALWEPPSGPARIYVNGLPVPGKIWFRRVGKSDHAQITADDDLDTELAERCICEAMEQAGMPLPQVITWQKLLALTAPSKQAQHQQRAAALPGERMARPTALTAHAGSETLDFSKIGIAPPGLTIYADHREPQAIVDLLRTVPNLTVEIESLPVGDFRASGVIIERKVVRDLEQSVISGRMFDEANRIGLEPNTVGVVLIEGDIYNDRTSLLVQNLIGAITCLSHVQGLNVMTSLDYRTTAYALAKICQHASSQGLGYELALRKTKPKALLDEKRFICQGLPGVSGGLAVALLEHFGSLRAIANADASALMRVKGLGPKTAERIVAAFG